MIKVENLENFKEVGYWLLTIFGIGVTWGHSQSRISSAEKTNAKTSQLLQDHIKDCQAAGYITTPAHDRLQQDCQKLWMSELAHIKDTLVEMRDEIKELRSKPT